MICTGCKQFKLGYFRCSCVRCILVKTLNVHMELVYSSGLIIFTRFPFRIGLMSKGTRCLSRPSHRYHYAIHFRRISCHSLRPSFWLTALQCDLCRVRKISPTPTDGYRALTYDVQGKGYNDEGEVHAQRLPNFADVGHRAVWTCPSSASGAQREVLCDEDS